MDAVERLTAIEEIRQLKYQYWRAIDHFSLDEMRHVISRHCKCDYGAYGVLEGREDILQFFEDTVYTTYAVMVHQGHNPEISIVNDHRAVGRWAYESWMLAREPRVGFWHVGYYEDEYIVEDGKWKIASTKGTYYHNVRVDDSWARSETKEWPPPPPVG